MGCIATFVVLWAAAACAAASPRGATSHEVDSFNKAKKALKAIYAGHRVTLYSGCSYNADMTVDYDDCRYHPLHPSGRALRIEWEHVVPAEAFGQAFVEWRDGHPDCIDRHGKPFKGRHCAAKINMTYRRVEADMHNLFPEIGELNARRSNYSMEEMPGDEYQLQGLAVKVGGRKFEPRPEVKGDVARVYLYMDAAYPGLGIVSRKNRKLFEAWNRMDPVDAWECDRARRIADVQGNINEGVDTACRQMGLATSSTRTLQTLSFAK